ncbi:MAG TPA: hypothetical protein VJI67_00775 [archaeon]|nr:hypothetical protein [archaeon]HLD80838.1 hypothetical protein [archaeon]
MNFEQVEIELNQIKARNKRVELDKAWETSLERRTLVAAFTYAVFVAFFLSAGLPNPYFNALVPSIAFLLSTLTLGFAKSKWIEGKK